MHLATFILILVTNMVTAFIVPPVEAPDTTTVDLVSRDTDCGACTRLYDFCVKNGHTKGQTGCMQTCREHVCHVNASCKGCGEPFDQCPTVSRYVRKE
ncbi:hypothetical protein IAQ61_000644 [Plenodomus lingam]|uniref:uncharacterized protein n=1 Tax=Leptosphaeria maculans TaxID=5022 RepID=UPI0033241D8F|nr:hypothetical protein IAQ61_000644 [Plenodomus lingam]